MACASLLTLGAGCAGLTKGVQTGKATWSGLLDTIKVSGEKVFDVAGKGAEAAEKIATATKEGAVSTVAPVTTTTP